MNFDALSCLIIGGHIALSEIFHPSQHFMIPHFSKIWASSLSENFHCHFNPIIHESTLHKALHNLFRWNTVYHSIQFSLSTLWCNHQLSTSFSVVAILPIGHSITTPPRYENLEKYALPANLTPPPQLSTKE